LSDLTLWPFWGSAVISYQRLHTYTLVPISFPLIVQYRLRIIRANDSLQSFKSQLKTYYFWL